MQLGTSKEVWKTPPISFRAQSSLGVPPKINISTGQNTGLIIRFFPKWEDVLALVKNYIFGT